MTHSRQPQTDHAKSIGSWPALLLCVLLVFSGQGVNGADVVAAKSSPEQIEFFETKIRPILADECYRCHSDKADKLKGGLHLDSRAGMLKGGETGSAIVPGQPDASLLIKAVRYMDQDTAMPPKKRLTDAQIAALRRTLGPPLAGCRALQRRAGRISRRRGASRSVALPRLGGRGAESRHALRSICAGADRGRSFFDQPRGGGRDGILCRRSHVYFGRRRSRGQGAGPGGDTGGSRGHLLTRVPWPDGGVCALPRSQVRPRHDEGLLRARRNLQQHEDRASAARVVQLSLSIDGYDIAWDTGHDDIVGGHAKLAKACDQGIAALIKDLKTRGLFDDTLLVWGGEFGRAPTSEGAKGRDHDHYGYTNWLAGGGVKRGFSYGATDEFGCSAVENRVHVHDFHATVLHLMGLDHEKLTYRYSGRDYRLTDVSGHVVHDIIS